MTSKLVESYRGNCLPDRMLLLKSFYPPVINCLQ
jgi:hypothetical protein